MKKYDSYMQPVPAFTATTILCYNPEINLIIKTINIVEFAM